MNWLLIAAALVASGATRDVWPPTVPIAIHAYLLRLRLTLVSDMNHAVSPSLFTVVAND